MKVLVLGGTRFMGVHMVNELLNRGHDVTIATRGRAADGFGDRVARLVIDREDADSLREALRGKEFDVTADNIAYASNDVKWLLDVLNTGRYVQASTCSVYMPNFRLDMKESDVDTAAYPLKWCTRHDFAYDEAKRQAEAALFRAYPHVPSAAVRLPYIFGKDDYTKRLLFYVEQIARGKAINIDNLDERLSFIDSRDAGWFMAHMVESSALGVFNANSVGTVSIREVIEYTEKQTARAAVLDENADAAPLNGCPSFSMDLNRAEKTGYGFMKIEDWLYPLIDYWTKEIT